MKKTSIEELMDECGIKRPAIADWCDEEKALQAREAAWRKPRSQSETFLSLTEIRESMDVPGDSYAVMSAIDAKRLTFSDAEALKALKRLLAVNLKTDIHRYILKVDPNNNPDDPSFVWPAR